MKIETIYMHKFDSKEAIAKEFDCRPSEIADIVPLLAFYTCENYEGTAFVLFEKWGQLYEVNGGHCSCNGLEEQWSPEETTVAALRHRMEQGELGMGYDWTSDAHVSLFADELKEILNQLEKQGYQ